MTNNKKKRNHKAKNQRKQQREQQQKQQQETYNILCNDLKNKIKEHYENDNITFIDNNDIGLMQIKINDNGLLTITKGHKWNILRQNIDKQLSRKKGACHICCEPKVNNVSCPKCVGDICGECYISSFKSNQGLIICPYCRFTYGEKIPKSFIMLGVNDIRQKLRHR